MTFSAKIVTLDLIKTKAFLLIMYNHDPLAFYLFPHPTCFLFLCSFCHFVPFCSMLFCGNLPSLPSLWETPSVVSFILDKLSFTSPYWGHLS